MDRPDRDAVGVWFVNRIIPYRDFWGTTKRRDLLDSLELSRSSPQYQVVNPAPENRYSFRPWKATTEYLSWPSVVDLASSPPFNGLMEKRGGALVDIERDALASRMQAYFDRGVDWEQIAAMGNGLSRDAAGFSARSARSKVSDTECFDERRIVRYFVRPFDNRWAYYSPTPPLWNRARPLLWVQAASQNAFLVTRPQATARDEGVPFCWTQYLGDNDALRGHAYYFPLVFRSSPVSGAGETLELDGHQPDISLPALSYLDALKVEEQQDGMGRADCLWRHVLAVGFADRYLGDHDAAVKNGWPRIPLPSDKNLLMASAALGGQIADLLTSSDDPAEKVPGLRSVGRLAGVNATSLNGHLGHLALTSDWGRASADNVVMPGPGRLIEREYKVDELSSLRLAADQLGVKPSDVETLLGESTFDVYLNDAAYWGCIPAKVWTFTIGGYQVMKKWLSYRAKAVLGRDLTGDEAREVSSMARRIAAILFLQPRLDENYQAVVVNCWPWPAVADEAS